MRIIYRWAVVAYKTNGDWWICENCTTKKEAINSADAALLSNGARCGVVDMKAFHLAPAANPRAAQKRKTR